MPRLPVDELESDWRRASCSPLLRARFGAQCAKRPALSAFSDPAAVVRFMRGPGGTTDKDAVLCALLAWAQSDAAGARVVFEVIRPGLLNLSLRVVRHPSERDELWSMLLAAVWDGIRTYPLDRRPRRVAANLLLDTLHQVLREAGRESEWRSIISPESAEQRITDPPDEDDDGDVDRLLSEAVKAGAVTAEEADTILSSRIDGAELAALADAAGVSYNVMRVRRQRAERRLLLFLGRPFVPRRHQKRPSSFARVAGAGPQGPVG